MMKKIPSVLMLVTFACLILSGAALADDSEGNCGAVFEGNWNVKNADDIKSHLKHHLKIDKTSGGKYTVKIKNDGGDIVFKSENDFSLTCTEDPMKAILTGNVKMGNCVHALEMTYPYETDNISINITTVHDKGECAGHKDSLHGNDRLNHTRVAMGKKRKK